MREANQAIEPDPTTAADDETQTGRPSCEELEDQVRELEDAAADHSERLLDLQRRLDESRHERNVLRDQLTTVHPRPRPRTRWLCTCPHNVLEHDADAACQIAGCPCPESLVEIQAARDAALRAVAELLPYAWAGAEALEAWEPYGPPFARPPGLDPSEAASAMLDRIKAGEFGEVDRG